MGSEECVYAKLRPCSLGLALGVMKGVFLLGLAYAGWLGGYGSAMIEHVAAYYNGYSASFVGGLIGAAYGFIGGFIIGYIFGFLYNFFVCRCCKKCS